MLLKINSFQQITESCEIDLSKKVILFVGHNNTGKTYVTQLIWAINNFVNFFGYFNDKDIFPIKFLGEKFDFAEKSVLQNDMDIKTTHIEGIAVRYAGYVKKHLGSVYKKDTNADFSLKFNIDVLKSKTIDINVGGSHWILRCSKRKNSLKIKSTLTLRSGIAQKEIDEIPRDVLNGYIEASLIKALLSANPVFMPSMRLFLPSFYKYIVTMEKEFKDGMFANLDKINDKNKKFFASSYTLPVDELIRKLVFQISEPIKNSRDIDTLARLMEGEISIDKSEDIGMIDISYSHKSGTKIPMYLSSSMVNQLATLYLYFKYWYKPEGGNFLLLDEPEMNLHPAKKIELLELLLNFASKNKLLMATHSSTLAKSLINYIHLFDLKKKHSKETASQLINDNNLKMDANIDLESNDIGIYYFNRDTIISYKYDDNSDIQFGTFTDIEKLQRKQYEEIMSFLEEYEAQN